METININEPIQCVQYGWVRDSMLRANAKYRASDRKAFNLKQKKYYDNHKDDPEYMEKMRIKAREYYYRKKAQKQIQIESPSSVL